MRPGLHVFLFFVCACVGKGWRLRSSFWGICKYIYMYTHTYICVYMVYSIFVGVHTDTDIDMDIQRYIDI